MQVLLFCFFLYISPLISEEMRERGRKGERVEQMEGGEQPEELHFNVGNRKIIGFDVPRQCPLVLLVKVRRREGKALGYEEGKGLGNVFF
jgi:hypothetical protein